jgi:hypothetical protein
MNLYITCYDRNKLKTAFLNLRKYQIIDTDEVALSLNYDLSNVDNYSTFIMNQRIKKIIKSTAVGKRMQSIIYVNQKLNDKIVRELINFCQDPETNIDKVIFIAEKRQYEEFYELFDEILFFPSARRVHIIECIPIPTEYIESLNTND